MDVYYHGTWRMDWGLGNPNKTAVLIACLMIGVWAVAQVWQRGFWLALAAFTGLAGCLVETYSRGGMMALLAGLAVLLAWAPRPWPGEKWVAVTASVGVVGSCIVFAGAESRYDQGLFSSDESIHSRFVIWKHFPEMLAAAPWGWGWGRAGDSYTQWFQPPGQSIGYLNLINSHLTWMTEGGWAFSVLYLLAWAMVILLCWPVRGLWLGPVSLAVWVAFGTGACFTHVEDAPWLWVLPLGLAGFVMGDRVRLKRWPDRSLVLLCICFSISAVALLIVAGFCTERLPIRGTGDAVTLGNGPSVCALLVDRSVMGKLYGHTLRKYLAEHASELSAHTYFVTESPHPSWPAQVSETIVSGRWMKEPNIVSVLARSSQVILVNPACYPEESPWTVDFANKTAVYFGEYSQSPSRSSWSSCPRVRILIIDGAGDFVPYWPKALWTTSGI